jgi:hypothetical protein
VNLHPIFEVKFLHEHPILVWNRHVPHDQILRIDYCLSYVLLFFCVVSMFVTFVLFCNEKNTPFTRSYIVSVPSPVHILSAFSPALLVVAQ